MANYGEQKCIALTAASNSAALKYTVMRYVAGGSMVLATANASSQAIGVLQGTPALGDEGEVCYDGRSKVVTGAAVTDGAYITHNTSGRAIAVVSGAMCIGKALTASGADGEIISALVFPPFRWSGAA